MLKALRKKIARRLMTEEFDALGKTLIALAKAEAEQDLKVNQRVAEILTQMDPFEPLLKKYNVIFSEEYERPEDRLNEQSQLMFFQWGYGMESDVHFKHLVNWIRNTQGNATLRKAKTDQEWLYGRSAVATITLFMTEVSRLASRYKDILAERDGREFDKNLTVE